MRGRHCPKAIDVPIRSGLITAEDYLDFRGTLGVSKEAPVVTLDTDATSEQVETLIRLTKQYYVIYESLPPDPALTLAVN